MAATLLKKVGTGPFYPLCSISSNSLNVWEVRRPLAWVLEEECCPIVVWCRILSVQLYSTGERSGQLITQTLLLQSHAVGMDVVCAFALSCSNMQRLPSKKHSICSHLDNFKTFTYVSALIVPFQMCKLPLTKALKQSNTIRDADFDWLWPEDLDYPISTFGV